VSGVLEVRAYDAHDNIAAALNHLKICVCKFCVIRSHDRVFAYGCAWSIDVTEISDERPVF
jgi:hypothetical protein